MVYAAAVTDKEPRSAPAPTTWEIGQKPGAEKFREPVFGIEWE